MKPLLSVFSPRRVIFVLIGLLIFINFAVLILKYGKGLTVDETIKAANTTFLGAAEKALTPKSFTSSTVAALRRSAKKRRDKEAIVEEKCILPNVDPWDPSIRKHLNPKNDPLKNCNITFEQRSFLDHEGYLWIRKPSNDSSFHFKTYFAADEQGQQEDCKYRCFDSIDGSHLIYSNWSEIEGHNVTRPECEMFEVQCFYNGTESYKFSHSQIIPVDDWITPAPNLPDVHIILIDGLSSGHFLRAMPATADYLRTDWEALIFPYLNKVGLNSRPNFYSLFLGERAESMQPNPWGPRKFSHGKDAELCAKLLDTENFIFYDFQLQGYKSMWSEDWWDATPSWPNCKSFREKPADHFMQAFALRFWANNTEKLWERLFNWNCRETHNYILDTLEDFINKYTNKAKISLSASLYSLFINLGRLIQWMTNLSHDYANKVYHADKQFKEFFVKMKKQLANSFVLFMSDHGNRYLLPTDTNIGEIEINNPFFVFSLPEHLRKNKDLVEQIYRNTHELISHFDVYATLLEISMNADQWTEKTNFSGSKFAHLNRTLIGSSLFHPLDQPRTCERLQIPFQYCICRHDYKQFQDPVIALKIADAMVKKMNEEIRASPKIAKLCLELHVNRTATAILPLREFESQGSKRIFRASIQTSPSQGRHDAFVEYENGNVTLITTRFPRNNSYKDQAHCISEQFLKNYCYCKEQKKKKKDTG